MLLGSGTHSYEWIGDWSKLPQGVAFGYTHGVVIDARNRLYIHNQSKDAVAIFDRDGHFLSSWGAEYAEGAHGLYLSREAGTEYLYLADPKRHLVAKTTLDGEELWRIGMPPRSDIYGSEAEYKPTDVAVAPNGEFYVFDGYGKSWVHKYSPHAEYILSFGGPGSAPGQLKCPHGGWVDTRKSAPELWVADRANNRIQVFTLDGKHLRFIAAEMKGPCCFYQWRDEMYVPDLQARVTILDGNDQPIAVLGDNPEAPKMQGWPNIQDRFRPGPFQFSSCMLRR